jgi:hypothetical protein
MVRVPPLIGSLGGGANTKVGILPRGAQSLDYLHQIVEHFERIACPLAAT